MKEVENQPTVFGHPAGLYTLFFAEMWERFSYYGMRALLIFYMTKGLLAMSDSQAYSVYGAYTALVYMTPFIGGLLADRIMGKRLAVVIGGILMAAGHLLMTYESEWPFYFALALLIAGNGFFKPNISTMVGTLYGQRDPRRDNGFNIFYMGINLGAAISPLLCGYIGEVYGWHWGFGLATIGMMVGLAVFIMPNLVSSALILAAAVATTIGLLVFRPDNVAAIGLNIFVAICLAASAGVSVVALNRGGLPDWAGRRPEKVGQSHDWKVYLGTAIAIPIFALLVSGFAPLMPGKPVEYTEADLRRERTEMLKKYGFDSEVATAVEALPVVAPSQAKDGYSVLPKSIVNGTKSFSIDAAELVGRTLASPVMGPDNTVLLPAEESLTLERIATLKSMGLSEISVIKTSKEHEGFETLRVTFLGEISKPAGLVLTVLGAVAFGYLFWEIFRLPWLYRDRMLAAMVLIFFNMLFFSFFEQAGNSLNVFTDRNVSRVESVAKVTPDMVGTTIRLQPTQAQLGYSYGDGTFTIDDLDKLRKTIQQLPEFTNFQIDWPVDESHVGMTIAERKEELPASIFQALNAVFILVFALVFNWIWSSLDRFGWNPPAAVKFGLGLIQLGLGFYALVIGASSSSEQGLISIWWLVLAYYLHTTGELCLSPVGLSAMTKLSAKHLVSTLMGAWFLATAFSQYLAGIISQMAGVKDDMLSEGFPTPKETLELSTGVFSQVGAVAVMSGVLCLLLSGIITYWMHEGVTDESETN